MNIAASTDHPLTKLDLALMPSYRRNLHLRHMGEAAPTAEEIEAEWRSWRDGAGGGRVYFVQQGYDPDAPIKIGTAKRPARRIAVLQTGSAERLVVLATCPGDRRMESEYHQRFAAYRMEGEWFRPAPAIMEEIKRLRADNDARKGARA